MKCIKLVKIYLFKFRKNNFLKNNKLRETWIIKIFTKIIKTVPQHIKLLKLKILCLNNTQKLNFKQKILGVRNKLKMN